MINQINVVALFVGDLKRSLKFYRDKVGLKVKVEDQGFAELGMKSGASVAIIERATAGNMISKAAVGKASKAGRAFTLAAYVDNVDSEYKALKRKGVEFIKPPVDQPWGQRTAYFQDPDGNLWEISHWIKGAAEKAA